MDHRPQRFLRCVAKGTVLKPGRGGILSIEYRYNTRCISRTLERTVPQLVAVAATNVLSHGRYESSLNGLFILRSVPSQRDKTTRIDSSMFRYPNCFLSKAEGFQSF
jgi:hypothetical protein